MSDSVTWLLVEVCYGVPVAAAAMSLQRRQGEEPQPPRFQETSWVPVALVILTSALLARGLTLIHGAEDWLTSALAPLPYFPLVLFVLSRRESLRVPGGSPARLVWSYSALAAAAAWLAGWMADFWPARVPSGKGFAALAVLYAGTTAIEEFLFRGLLLPRLMFRLGSSSWTGLATATSITVLARVLAGPQPRPALLSLAMIASGEAVRHWCCWKARHYAVAVLPTAVYRLLGMPV